MPAAADKPTLSAPRRFSIGLPRPLSIGLATAILILVAVALHVGVPIYRQRTAIRKHEGLADGAWVGVRWHGPEWLRQLLGDEWLDPFFTVESAVLMHAQVTDASLRHLHWLPDLQVLHIED